MLPATRVDIPMFVKQTDNAVTGIRDTRVMNCNKTVCKRAKNRVHVVVGLSTKLFRLNNDPFRE